MHLEGGGGQAQCGGDRCVEQANGQEQQHAELGGVSGARGAASAGSGWGSVAQGGNQRAASSTGGRASPMGSGGAEWGRKPAAPNWWGGGMRGGGGGTRG